MWREDAGDAEEEALENVGLEAEDAHGSPPCPEEGEEEEARELEDSSLEALVEEAVLTVDVPGSKIRDEDRDERGEDVGGSDGGGSPGRALRGLSEL